jgi:flagellar M-ring protein FliF
MRGLDLSQVKYAQEIEQGYIRRIEAILQPVVGANNVHAQVAADIDFSIVENTDEKYRPNQEPGSAAIRSQQVSESSQPGTALPGGVPGALSNQPPVNPVAPIVTPVANAQPGGSGGNPGNTRKDGTTNYELDRSIRHVQQGAGGIKRLSVAVVVNYRSTQSAPGKWVPQALAAAELEQIKNLVKETMGFSAERGDSLNVVNSPFATDPVIDIPELPWWRQSDNLELAKASGKYLLLGMLALYLWFAVLRPLLRKHLQPAPAPVGAGVAGKETASAAGAAAQVQADTREREEQRHLDNIQYAQKTAANDPQTVAMLMKHWMDHNNG